MFVFVVKPFVYLAFLFFNEKITKAQGLRGVSKGGAGGAIAPPLFGTIEGAAGDGATHAALLLYITTCPPPHFKKLLTPLISIQPEWPKT